jgi:SPP1 gp7 family putative phage head morphogenesis protein
MPQKTIASLAISNAINYERYKDGHIKAVMPILNTLNKAISDIILRMDITSPRDVSQRIKRINTLIDTAFDKIKATCLREYKELIKHAIEQEQEPLSIFKEEEISFTEEEKEGSLGTLLAALILGKSFTSHITELRTSAKAAVSSQVRIGVADKENITTIMQRVRGTRSRRFQDGIFNKTLRDTDAVLRTAIQTYVNRGKQFAWKKFGVKQYIWISVLDGSTTSICISRSSKIYVVGQGPLPPAHYRCRSIISIYVSGMEIPQNYGEWLRGQPQDVVEDVLGKTKASMFLDGKLDLSKFVSASGRELTIKELRNRG